MKHVGALDYIKSIISWLAFGIILVLIVYSAFISIQTQDMTPELMGRVYTQIGLATLLTLFGRSAVFSTMRLIIIAIGGRAYNGGKAKTGIGYRFVKASENVRNSKDTIDKYGLIVELEESIDFINMESRVSVYDEMIDKKIYKISKKLQKKKARKDKELSRKLKDKIVLLKEDKRLISTYRVGITQYNRETCDETDLLLSEKYGEPKYHKIYSRDVYNVRSDGDGIISKFMNSGFTAFFKYTIKPIMLPAITAFIGVYYIINYSDTVDPAAMILFWAVMGTSGSQMLKAVLNMLTGRFELYDVRPIENNSYIFSKFNSRHKDKINDFKKNELPDDIQGLIDQYTQK